MACFSSIHQAIARLQAISAKHSQLEPACLGPTRYFSERKLRTFSRYKRRELAIHSAEVDFAWKGSGSQVLLTGDFLGWDRKVLLDKGTDGVFHFKLKLLPGIYNYKYVIDGVWAHSPDSPTVEDGQGGYNNQITVTDGPHGPKESSPVKVSSRDTASLKDVSEAVEMAPEAMTPSILPKMVEEAAPEAASLPSLPKRVEVASEAAATQTPSKTAEEAVKSVARSKTVEENTKVTTPPKIVKEAPSTVDPLKTSESSKPATSEAPSMTAPAPKTDKVVSQTAEAKEAEAPSGSNALKVSPVPTTDKVVSQTAEAKEAEAPSGSKALKAAPAPAPKTVAPSKPAAAPPKPSPAAKAAKKVEKPYPQMITEDVIPKVKTYLQKHEGLSNVEVDFQDNQLEGSFLKNSIAYAFWAFFPDGKLEGARGFSVSSHGAPPSTIEPFLIDEKRITSDLIAFWVLKRLAAQQIINY